MADFDIALQGERQAGLRFEQFPDQARAALHEAIEELVAELYDRIEAMVPRRTGKLAAEIHSFVDETETRITGRVKVVTKDRQALLKAIAEEYGAHGLVKVKTHLQHLSHVYGRLIQPMVVVMDKYERHANIVARRYERGPLDGMRGEIDDKLRAALESAGDAI